MLNNPYKSENILSSNRGKTNKPQNHFLLLPESMGLMLHDILNDHGKIRLRYEVGERGLAEPSMHAFACVGDCACVCVIRQHGRHETRER